MVAKGNGLNFMVFALDVYVVFSIVLRTVFMAVALRSHLICTN